MEQDDFLETQNQSEQEEDLENSNAAGYVSAVLHATDWTTETIIGQIKKGNIQLNPDFQRRDAWDQARKSKFIESLILGFPVPQIVLAESKESKGKYLVLDGKQRLLSIIQFWTEDHDPIFEKLKLKGIEILPELNGKTLSDVSNSPVLYDHLNALENQSIRTIVIKNWPNEDFLYHVFLRLNTGSVPLSPQELRQALHPGPFVKFLDAASGKSAAMREILKKSKPDFRMRDAELLLRYFAFKNNITEYKGSLKLFLDSTCNDFNNDWDNIEQVINSQLHELEITHSRIKQIFGNGAYRKWTGKAYENRFNRSIFDVMMFSLSDPNHLHATNGRDADIEQAFKDLCVDDTDFLSSIESTTKSLNATVTRLAKWQNKLSDVLQLQMPAPYLDAAGRIRI